ncbi:GNAT family N-acetyltransferase [Saccharibacillus sp. CPCC 101409]|uniref:GNAT family N-acetyltransferase n=1 Tax=Saccharibacillus sp. CPCC 101409 TaxID=3058041 RepID=UPI002673EF1D|nr:GNAT family N-acetyltransferase [Saccharibacillus sp. CPCC 101409]MDO3409299.1 GNAT family N-acetyltransferase [Saccharibacillus sp. CPCC 101409]
MQTKVTRVENEEQLRRGLAVRREVFIEEQQVPEELEVDDYDAIGSRARHVLIEQAGEEVAAGRLIPYQGGAAKFQRIAVRSAFRGKGYGRVVVAALEDAAREAGFRRAVLDSQCHAEAFYAGLGYVTKPGEPFYDAGILHVRMEKELGPL